MSNTTTTTAAPTTLSLPMAADMHVHLRQGAMCEAVTKQLPGTGVDTYLVMPNLIPPLTTTAMAVAYREQLQALAPGLNFLMTLYLSPQLTPDEVRAAAAAGITGVKSYPRGVTTNSDGGVENYETYYPVFAAMEEAGMILNLHGECPSSEEHNITILNAEAKFLRHLAKIHAAFPKLRIVLEHATTADAVAMVKSLGDTVACSITVHHLFLTVEDWAGLPHGFCKPVAKTFADRAALREVIASGHPRFFLGTDSAPHPRHAKESAKAPAGLFTSLHPLPYLAHLFHKLNMLDKLENFACVYGRKFYGLPVPTDRRVTLTYTPEAAAGTKIPEALVIDKLVAQDGKTPVEVVPFLAGETIPWTLSVRE
ncbi:dihydroorotase [Blastocladiella emersonii ATCC 22665]|nr:dihydroorotase [Blastocladiella emersonii ATCC 22665]